MESNLLDRITKGNNKIKDLNIGDFEGKIGIEKISKVDIRNFLNSSQKIIREYIQSKNVRNLYEISKRKYNGTSLKYRRVNPLPDEQEVIKEFYKEIPDIENLDNETIIYELAKTAFWANKITKIICRPAKGEIQKNVTREEYSRMQQYYQRIKQADFETEKKLYEEDESFRENFYKYNKIMRAEDFNYFIKSVSIRTMFSLLVKDNYDKFKMWGIYRDKKGNLVFAIDFPR